MDYPLEKIGILHIYVYDYLTLPNVSLRPPQLKQEEHDSLFVGKVNAAPQ